MRKGFYLRDAEEDDYDLVFYTKEIDERGYVQIIWFDFEKDNRVSTEFGIKLEREDTLFLLPKEYLWPA